MSIERLSHFGEEILHETQYENRELSKESILKRMKYYRTPAVSIAFIKDYKVQCVKTFGTKKRDGKESIDENTLFQAASISKSIFAVAIMKLVEGGIFDLDEDINKYLISWKVPDNESWKPRITLRQLLSHTAGVTVHGFDGYNVNDEIPTLLQILNGEYPANSDPIRVNIPPEVQFRYSGGGYTILQQVMLDTFKRPFDDIMRELVLDPLEMNNSRFQQPISKENTSKIAWGYGYTGDEIEAGYHIYPELAAAGLWTTPSDLAKFGIELQLILKGKDNGILKLESLEDMFKMSTEVPYGLGLDTQGDEPNILFGHGGHNFGFLSDMFFSKDGGEGFVLMINSNSDGLTEELKDNIKHIYGWATKDIKNEFDNDLEDIKMESYTGEYISEKGLALRISRKEKKLFVEFNNQLPIEFIKKGDSKFLSTQVNGELRFIKDEKLDITDLELIIDEKVICFKSSNDKKGFKKV